MILCILYALLWLVVATLVGLIVWKVLSAVLAAWGVTIEPVIWQLLGLAVLLIVLIYFWQSGACALSHVLK